MSGSQIGRFDLFLLPPKSLKTKKKVLRSYKDLQDDPLVSQSDADKARSRRISKLPHSQASALHETIATHR